MHEKWIAFNSRIVAEWRQIVAGDVLYMVALVAHHQGWTLVSIVALSISLFVFIHILLDAAWPDDPDAVKEPSRRW